MEISELSQKMHELVEAKGWYAADSPRPMWLYRDWLIKALNDNMPFDRFTIEQLAGDILPNGTTNQKIATGFHRNSMQALGNNPRKEEFRVKGIVDRIDTTGRVPIRASRPRFDDWNRTTILST